MATTPIAAKHFHDVLKENAHDYRYFPEPDLLPVKISAEQVEAWRAELPELPSQRRERYVNELGLSEYDAKVLTSDKTISDFYEATVANTQHFKLVANYMMGKVASLVTEKEMQANEESALAKRFGGSGRFGCVKHNKQFCGK